MCQNRSLFSRTKKMIAMVMVATSSSAFALSADSVQALHITADSSSFNYKLGNSSYEGNVKVDQGTTHLNSDKLTTHNNAQHKIEEAIAYGITHLAEYITIPKDGDEQLHAKAKTIKFYPAKSLVILEGNVIVTQGKNSFNGPIIYYNTKDQTIDAPASKSGRATIVIEPEKLKS